MKLTFEHNGQQHALVKSARAQKLSDNEQALAPWYLRCRQPDGSRTWRLVGQAGDNAGAIRNARAVLNRSNIGGDQYSHFYEQTKARAGLLVGTLLQEYVAHGYPGPHGATRAERTIDAEKSHIPKLMERFRDQNTTRLTRSEIDGYQRWRCANKSRGTGERVCELELMTLRNVFTWAVAQGRVAQNPIPFVRLRKQQQIAHARDFMPSDGDELHAVAAWLLCDPRTATQGWRCLFQSFTGLRDDELRGLMRDPKPSGLDYPAGYIDNRYLYVSRRKHGCNGRIVLDDPDRPHIRPLLLKIRAWSAARYPNSPYLFPGRSGKQLATRGGLTRALALATAALKLPERHSHGLRAYYATARLAQGISADQVAFELGQKSGAALVQNVYGDTPPHWEGLANRFTWLPQSGVKPAWERLDQPSNVVRLQTQAAA